MSNKKSEFNMLGIVAFYCYNGWVSMSEWIESIVSPNEVVTISVLKVKACHHHSQQLNVTTPEKTYTCKFDLFSVFQYFS